MKQEVRGSSFVDRCEEVTPCPAFASGTLALQSRYAPAPAVLPSYGIQTGGGVVLYCNYVGFT